MKYLRFDKVGEYYVVYNSSDDIIAWLGKVRNGTWMHWNLIIPQEIMKECLEMEQSLTFSPGCMDEIREFCRELNGNNFVKSKDGVKKE